MHDTMLFGSQTISGDISSVERATARCPNLFNNVGLHLTDGYVMAEESVFDQILRSDHELNGASVLPFPQATEKYGMRLQVDVKVT
jgi:hypothetical protein